MARLELGVDITVEGARELTKVSKALDGTSDELDDLAKHLDEAADSARRMADDIDEAAQGINFDSASRSANNLEDAGEGVRNAINGVSDVMAAAGDESLALHERAALAAGGLADMANGARNAVIPMLQGIKNGALTSGAAMVSSAAKQVAAWAILGVQSLANGAKVAAAWLLALGPIGLLIAAVAAVVAIIILNWDKVLAFLKAVFKKIGDALAALGRFFVEVWNGIMDFLGGIVRGVADIGKKLWEPIGKGFGVAIDFIKGIWNAFARWWNSIEISVPSIDLPIIGRVGGFTIGLPDLPMLAAGGIVTGPTLAVLGEKGPEAVIPLDRAGVGTNVTLNIYGDVEGDERRIPGQVLRGLYVAGLTN